MIWNRVVQIIEPVYHEKTKLRLALAALEHVVKGFDVKRSTRIFESALNNPYFIYNDNLAAIWIRNFCNTVISLSRVSAINDGVNRINGDILENKSTIWYFDIEFPSNLIED